LADAIFDRARYVARLTTHSMGRQLVTRASAESTNDEAWDALAAGLGDGVAVVADAQSAGRGRSGRAWAHAPGKGLALSVALHLGCDVRQAGVIPLGAGLALQRAIASLGVRASLKWPNDLLLNGRKLAGILCEVRHMAAGGDAVVIGVGVNVRQGHEDFPPDVAPIAMSLAMAGIDTGVEDVAAAFLNAFEPLWPEMQEGDRAAILDAWAERADFWGQSVTVRAPGGTLSGIAQRLDPDGALVLRLENGTEHTVLAGDVVLEGSEGSAS
jgi:BirA family biotin operon repressor/biotin-[acetyl-CoA-carboxylase] ligase